jgi:nucleoside-diphosphate-sugar epimerase
MNTPQVDYNSSILVTGATGFLGAYLLRHLLSKGYHNIRGLKRAGSPEGLVAEFKDSIEWVEGDVLDIFSLEDALAGIQQVYHCAAVVSFNPAEHSHMMKVNEIGTANLVNQCLEAGIDKLVHVSSIAAIGRIKEGNTISESTKWQKSSFNTQYAISKFKSEQQVWRGMAEGLTVAIVNPGIILGSGYWESGTPQLFDMVSRGYAFYPTGAASLVDARDVVRFIVLLMESEVAGERFILHAEHWSYKKLLTAIANALGQKPPHIRVSKWMRGLAWRLAWVQSKLTGNKPVLTRETAENSSRTFYYDNSKSLSVFDFKYLPVEETITETARQFQESGGQPVLLPEK